MDGAIWKMRFILPWANRELTQEIIFIIPNQNPKTRKPYV